MTKAFILLGGSIFASVIIMDSWCRNTDQAHGRNRPFDWQDFVIDILIGLIIFGTALLVIKLFL